MAELVWHRTDIRTEDNPALSNAQDPIPLYIFDPRILEFASNRRVEWVRRNVDALKREYDSMDAQFLIRYGRSPAVLQDIVESYDIDKIHFNKSYSPLGQKRDNMVREVLDVPIQKYHGEVMFSPQSIYTNAGEPYSTFTYYNKKWQKLDKDDVFSISHVFPEGPTEDVPSIQELGFKEPSVSYPKAGTAAAKERLLDFIHHDIESYAEERDVPPKESTSKLSFYLSYGILGIRDVWHTVDNNTDDTKGVRSYKEQLAWRDFYTQILYHNPHVVTQNHKEYENDIQWKNNKSELEAWKAGKTGYPIVDAGMRQLEEEGWMHNRVRMIVASFLTKDLLIDWKKGYDWFREKLIDHNTANNNGGWQWAASTGTDSQPYFRIFNPMKQGEEYDPEAEYIKQYIDELSDASPSNIHRWHKLNDSEREYVASEYVEPIVSHSERREKALSMFENAKGDKED